MAGASLFSLSGPGATILSASSGKVSLQPLSLIPWGAQSRAPFRSSGSQPIEIGTMTLTDIVDVVRRQRGEKAAGSAHFTSH